MKFVIIPLKINNKASSNGNSLSNVNRNGSIVSIVVLVSFFDLLDSTLLLRGMDMN